MEWLRAIAGDMRCGSPCRMSDCGIANCFGVPGIRSWLSAACLLHLGVWENSAEASVFLFVFVRKSGTDGARGGRCAQEMIDMGCLLLFVCTKQTVHPTASLFVRLCVISEGVTTGLQRLLERERCRSPTSSDPHGGDCIGRFAEVCGAMGARTRLLCMLTKCPVRQQSCGSRSLQ